MSSDTGHRADTQSDTLKFVLGRKYGNILEGGEYKSIHLEDVDFSMLDMRNVLLSACTFINCKFEGAWFSSGILRNCLFRKCSFRDSYFPKTKLDRTTFSRCSFDGATFWGNDWDRVDLDRCAGKLGISSTSVMRGCKMSRCDLQASTIHRSSIADTRFRMCNLTGMCFRDTCLDGVDFGNSIITDVLFNHIADGSTAPKIDESIILPFVSSDVPLKKTIFPLADSRPASRQQVSQTSTVHAHLFCANEEAFNSAPIPEY